jgi:hypothetical protein
MTKKGRTLNRWKQRWWQLLDNGYLFYFKSDDRLKILGQVDIARSCYDVRLGSQKCRVNFPRAAPSCCCISFAVLKRNFYVYTPTAGEAEKWAQAMSDMSRVINRKVVAGVERRKAPDPPGPFRPPSCPPPYQVKMAKVKTGGGYGRSDSCEDISRMRKVGRSDSYEDFSRIEHTRSNNNLLSQRMMAISVPDYLDKIGDDTASLGKGTGEVSLDSRLWLDGSPPPARGSLVHPQDEPLVTDLSWGSPTTDQTPPPQEVIDKELTDITATGKKRSESQLPRERLYSLPTKITVDCETLKDQQDDDTTKLQTAQQVHLSTHQEQLQDSNEEPIYDRLEKKRFALSKGMSKSMGNLLSSDPQVEAARPVPKPRKPRTLTNPATAQTEIKCLTLQPPAPLHLPEMRPRNSSEPPQIRPRKNSGALSKKPHRSSKCARRSKRLSPPSTPPPPPPPTTIGDYLPPKPVGPPKFVPPPPPIEEML